MLVLTLKLYDKEKNSPYVELTVPPSEKSTVIQVVRVSDMKVGFIAPLTVPIVRNDAKHKF